MRTKDDLLDAFRLFAGGTGGIDSWLADNAPPEVWERLGTVDQEPLTLAQLNQLLALSHEAPMAEGFFRYYWLEAPLHVYDVTRLAQCPFILVECDAIHGVEHLRWGLFRFYVDALLFFGNIRTAYRTLRAKSFDALVSAFSARRIDFEAMSRRAAALPLRPVAKDDRYLISEMACKSYQPADDEGMGMRTALLATLREHAVGRGEPITVRQLMTGDYFAHNYPALQAQFELSADDFIDQPLRSEAEFDAIYERASGQFLRAREAALWNTNMYLSMVGDLDVYVATSMRTRNDFRSMADFCESLFASKALSGLYVRYFDPTMSAAQHHEDKGLIECLMVKCAKVLVFNAGASDSYGKDAEAAMALSLGKPVIFYCPDPGRMQFYRDVHPLSRLIEFSTGVAVGCMVATTQSDVAELLSRLFYNRMEYTMERKADGTLLLKEAVTDSVVRLQTSDSLVRETFWNY